MNTKFFLDTRVTGTGLSPLKYSIAHNGKTTYITTDIKLLPQNWNSKLQQVVGGAAKQAINTHLLELKLKYDKYIQELAEQGRLKGLQVTDIRDLINSRFMNIEASHNTIAQAGDRHYSKLSKGSQDNWRTTHNILREYDKNFDARDFNFLTREYVKGFCEYCWNKVTQNTAWNYINTFHVLVNEALNNEIILRNPFRGIKVLRTPTKKRNVSDENFVKFWLAESKFRGDKIMHDMFKLSFLMIGMNTVDILKFNEDSLHNYICDGRLEYDRSKTGRHYSIKIEPEAQAIIDSHRGKEHYLEFSDRFTNRNSPTASSYRHLKNLCETAGIPRITMYYARHTWATMAHRIGISKDDISLALGHSFGISTTDIYIEYNSDRIDAANRKVINHLNSLLAEARK